MNPRHLLTLFFVVGAAASVWAAEPAGSSPRPVPSAGPNAPESPAPLPAAADRRLSVTYGVQERLQIVLI